MALDLLEKSVLLHLWLFHYVVQDDALGVVMNLHKDSSGGLLIVVDNSNRRLVQASNACPFIKEKSGCSTGLHMP